MELFEKTQKLKKLKEDMNKTNKEILEILDGFLEELQYQTKLIRTVHQDRQEGRETEIAVYYPELTVPNGFCKENERYFRIMSNVLEHQYTLVNEKGKIIVNEKATFINRITKRDENKNEVAILQLKKSYIIAGKIDYSFEIEGEYFHFLRTFSFGDILEQLLGEQHLDYSDSNTDYNEKPEKDYEKFLESLDVKKEEIIPLKNIIKCKEREHLLSSAITVCFEVIQNEFDEYSSITLENPQSDACVLIPDFNLNYSIKLKIVTTKTREILCEKVFEYKEKKSKFKYQNGCTLSEIFKLFKF